MVESRRLFLKKTSALALGTLLLPDGVKANTSASPVILTTWNSGLKSNPVGWEKLAAGARAIDVCEAGVRIIESDPNDTSVGLGGFPDRDGKITLDACVMDEFGNCGSVVFLEEILHPCSVARMVMEKTPHVYLAGSGAQQFALENGFKKQNLHTELSMRSWLEWKKNNSYNPSPNATQHDTVGMIALDTHGNLGGVCSTSGWAYKIRGRFGDSPVIGAGLFVDNEVGAATATGLGEAMIKSCGTFLIVEKMRDGMSPQKACEHAVKRIYNKYPSYRNELICFIAIDKSGNTGSYGMKSGFEYTVTHDGKSELIKSDYLVKE
ncbi:MAG: N(4)-(beta-N-acetylglucosaminyl)-L-asparaginase [Bacteroidetes bacterium]|nr:N(4)-(beta-N-acetylglucosaminyl)-L-asparaginase [Bacteroidota bacterium]